MIISEALRFCLLYSLLLMVLNSCVRFPGFKCLGAVSFLHLHPLAKCLEWLCGRSARSRPCVSWPNSHRPRAGEISCLARTDGRTMPCGAAQRSARARITVAGFASAPRGEIFLQAGLASCTCHSTTAQLPRHTAEQQSWQSAQSVQPTCFTQHHRDMDNIGLRRVVVH